jgi:undecaprenyl-diphosphatase
MTILHAVLLGIVEGVTEFLPISSTGHLIIAERLLGLASSEFSKSFSIVIQLGAILAVLTVYGRRLLTDSQLFRRVAVAFAPTVVLGLLFYSAVKSLLGNSSVVLWAMGVGGVLLILFEKLRHEPADAHEDLSTLPYRTAALLGLAQSVAMVPGVSRSAATIVGGLWLGLSRRAIVEFSFLLAIPTMAAASALDLYKNASAFSGAQWELLSVGFVTSWIVAWGVISWLLRYIRTHDFTAFGVYRIIAAVLFWLVLR